MGGRTLFRLLCRDAGGDTEQVLLGETVPAWVMDITVDVSIKTGWEGGGGGGNLQIDWGKYNYSLLLTFPSNNYCIRLILVYTFQ